MSFSRYRESLQENVSHKILWNFEIQMDPPNLTRRSDQFLNYKKKICNLEDSVVKKNTVEHECYIITNRSWYAWNSAQRLGDKTSKIRNQKKNRPEYWSFTGSQWNAFLLLHDDVAELADIWDFVHLHLPLEDPQKMFYWVQVWRYAWPVHHLYPQPLQ